MSLHSEFRKSPYAIPRPDQRWFPAAEDLRASAYEKLLPPLVANLREEVSQWRADGYPGTSPTSAALLRHWFGALPRKRGGGRSPTRPFDAGEAVEFEERWTGGYIFENEWQSFRTRRQRDLELITAEHIYDRPGRYTIAVKVIDIFGNDTMTLVPINVG